MSLPTNRIKKVKLPNNTEYEIIPEKISDGSGNYVTLPNLDNDIGKIAVNNINNNFTTTQTFGTICVGDINTYNDDAGLHVDYTESEGTYIATPGHFTAYGDNDDIDTNKPDDETSFDDLDTDYFNTGITLKDSASASDNIYKLSFPAKSGIFATTDDCQIPIEDLTQINS